jgi:hypothetical protein
MQAYETGLKGSDTRMVMSPKSDFFPFFWHTQWSAGNARRGCAVCSPLAHDPHKSDHARCAAAALGSILSKRDAVEADGILGPCSATATVSPRGQSSCNVRNKTPERQVRASVTTSCHVCRPQLCRFTRKIISGAIGPHPAVGRLGASLAGRERFQSACPRASFARPGASTRSTARSVSGLSPTSDAMTVRP